jgi:hypothetical protein
LLEDTGSRDAMKKALAEVSAALASPGLPVLSARI